MTLNRNQEKETEVDKTVLARSDWLLDMLEEALPAEDDPSVLNGGNDQEEKESGDVGQSVSHQPDETTHLSSSRADKQEKADPLFEEGDVECGESPESLLESGKGPQEGQPRSHLVGAFPVAGRNRRRRTSQTQGNNGEECNENGQATLPESQRTTQSSTEGTSEQEVATAIALDETEYERRVREIIQNEAVVASAIVNVDENDTNSPAIPAPEAANSSSNNFMKKPAFLLAMVILIVGCAAAIIGVVLASRGGGSKPVHQEPFAGPSDSSLVTSPPIRSPVFPSRGPPSRPTPEQTNPEEDLLNYLISISYDNGTSLMDESSPQYKAYRWLLQDTGPNQNEKGQRSRYALAVLYFATDGDNWARNDGWLSSKHGCQWHFDHPQPCRSSSGSGVKNIYLVDNNLRGTIPDEIGLIKFFAEELNLEGNELTGSIPTTLFDSSKLDALNLGRNQLNGTIPEELVSNKEFKPNLLDLSENNLHGTIPTLIGGLDDLELLHLHGNQLSGSLPSSLGNLTRLENVRFDENRLSGSLPSSLGDLTRLENARFDDNAFSGIIPASLGGIEALANLTLCDNNFEAQDLGPDFCEVEEGADSRHWTLFTTSCDSETGISCPCCTFCCS